MTTKKRSRFATDKIASVIPDTTSTLHNYADDYMAPLEQLLDLQQAQIAAPAVPSVPQGGGKRNLQTLMEESREQSMAVPISNSNVGFKLLQKFGYSEGQGLGKDNKGIVDPVAVQKRTNRDVSGLGVIEQKERKEQQLQTLQKVKQTYLQTLETSFRRNQITSNSDVHTLRDMKKSQKIIYELDEQAGVEVHELTASLHHRYHRMNTSNTGTVDPTSSVISNSTLSRYNTDIYDRYSGVDTIDTALEDDHIVHEETSTAPTAVDIHLNTGSTTVSPPADPSLLECLLYLREQYCYCYYCGAQFDDTEDLTNNCPGLNEDDH